MYNFQKQRPQQLQRPKHFRASHKQLPELYTHFGKPAPQQIPAFPPSQAYPMQPPAPPPHRSSRRAVIHQAHPPPPPPPPRHGVAYVSQPRAEAPSQLALRLQAEIDEIMAKIGTYQRSECVEDVSIMHASPSGDYIAAPQPFRAHTPPYDRPQPQQQHYIPRPLSAPPTPVCPESAISPLTVRMPSRSRESGKEYVRTAQRGITFNENVWADSWRGSQQDAYSYGRPAWRDGARMQPGNHRTW